MQWIKPNINIDFMGKIRIAATVSTVALVVSLFGVFVYPGPRFGVDFAGGASLQVRMREGIDIAAVKDALVAQGYESPEVFTAADGSFLIRVRVDSPSDRSRDALAEAIRKAIERAGGAPAAQPEGAATTADAGPADLPVVLADAPTATAEASEPAEEPTASTVLTTTEVEENDAAGDPIASADVPTAEVEDATPTGVATASADAGATPSTSPAPEVAVGVRVDEVIVDTSGAKVDILVNRPFAPEALRDILGPVEFEGRRMSEMLGRLVPPAESVVETRNPDGTYRYDVPLAQVVNLNEQDIGPVKEIVKGTLAAEGVVRTEDLLGIDVTLAPIALRINSKAPMDRARLAAALDRTRYRDINLFVRCRSAICPTSIDEREQVYGYQVNLRGFGPDVVESLEEQLGKGAVVEELAMEWVGPKVGEKLRSDGIKSVLIALGLILIYVALRFDVRFAPGAVLCLFHDAVITLGFFAFTGMEVNLTTVAAILTIVGYSVNDTIVVYDRIRENLQRTKERHFSAVVNASVNETLSRTVLTSVTTILAVLTVAFFGRGVIQDFGVAMIVGVIIGTYSSIYVAAPLSIVMDQKLFRRRQV